MLKDILLRLRALFSRRRMDQELQEELDFHIEMQARKNRRADADAANAADAERRARLEFGSVVRAAEECRDERGISALEDAAKDVRFSLRLLRKSPGFTIIAVLTLALAIGANAVVFGVLNGVILRPLDLPRAASLYGIEHGNEHSMYESYPDYLDLRNRNRSFEDLAAFTPDEVGLDTGDNATTAWADVVSGNYFDVLGIQPYAGRFFHGSDEHGPNSAPYIVLNHAFWHTHFQDDPAVVGRTVRLNKHPFTIIGVAPPGINNPVLFFSPAFFVPMVNQEQIEGKNKLDARATELVFMTLGHLKPGVTTAQAAADLNSIGAYLKNTYPKDHGATTFTVARPGLYGNYLGGPLRAFVTGLMVLTGLILLAACANLGGLFAARAADRAREVALRLSLGATRGRILRQLLTEAVLISLAGGAVGLWGSVALLRGLALWHPLPRFPISMPVSPDTNVYLIALVLALMSGFLFGIVPVRQVFRTNPYEIIKAGPSGRVGRRMMVRDVLLLAQIAICAVLITASIVAVRGLARSLNSNFGFEPKNALLADTDLNMAGYTAEQAPAMQKQMLEAIGAIPGVEAAGSVQRPQLAEGSYGTLVFKDETTDLKTSNAVANAIKYDVSPEYFRAAGTALLLGRPFSWYDDKDATRVAIVNQRLAARMFGSAEKALGRQFKLRGGTRVQVVGVAQDGKYETLTEDQLPAVFLPMLQAPITETWFVVRSHRDPEQMAAAIRTTLRGLDSGIPVYIQTWNQELNSALFPSRMAALALGVLGVIGAMLSITGIFGMAAYSVSKRMRELGIRIALGAERREVLQAALGRPFKLLVLGSMSGVALGVLASRVLALIVYQATPRDPVVLTGAIFSMLLLGLLATWIPARRALSIDPLRLLRED